MGSKPPSQCSPPKKRARLVGPDESNDILPTDVLQEVLLRLPSKCLGRLRTVCQSWRRMLSDPVFVFTHASRSNADSILVVAAHYPDRELVDLILVDVATGAVLKRMDGLARRRELLCFVGPGPGGGAVQVLDPATDDTTEVCPPPDPYYDHASFPASFYLVGHVPATGEHKVLHVTDVRGEQSCEVFSIGAGGRERHQRWRTTRSTPPVRVESSARRRAVVNGVAYFLPFRFQDLTHYDIVTAFDLETEEWRPAPIQGPVCNREESGLLLNFSLAELDGRLVMVHRNYNMDMYSLTDAEKGKWSKTLSLRLDWVVHRECEYFAQPLAVLDDGRIALFVPGTVRGVLRVYDPTTETSTDMLRMYRDCTVAGLYRGSILPFRATCVKP
uniref:Uncharacterized protein n=1 Tax=Avena sativa TaxID=4498 RepID=A0ACD5TN59_AVESA